MGSNDATSQSKPVSAAERAQTYKAGIANLQDSQNALPWASYQAPGYESLSGGDYDKLQQSILDSRMSPINQAMQSRFKDLDQSMADRGLYTSGLPDQAKQKMYVQDFQPAIVQAGADAATQRYGMEATDLQGKNAAAMENAQRGYDSSWRPQEYLQGLWNGTGGIVSNSTSSGWSI
jgi:hypothetical protein